MALPPLELPLPEMDLERPGLVFQGQTWYGNAAARQAPAELWGPLERAVVGDAREAGPSWLDGARAGKGERDGQTRGASWDKLRLVMINVPRACEGGKGTMIQVPCCPSSTGIGCGPEHLLRLHTHPDRIPNNLPVGHTYSLLVPSHTSLTHTHVRQGRRRSARSAARLSAAWASR